MKTVFFTLSLLIFSVSFAYSQEKSDDSSTEEGEVFTVIEDPAEFPGGMIAFFKYVGKHLTYPEEARKMGIEGKVYVQFIVETDGSLSNFKVVRGIAPSCDREAIRVCQGSPKWKPGMQRGKPARQRIIVPFNFSLK